MRRLYRSKKNKMIAGICGGIAENINQDPTLVRLLVVLVGLLTAILPLALIYVICWIIIPEEDQQNETS
ncbi:MAG: PspC domain-containing protein [Thermodesulfobacteriota bacterium]